MLLERRTLQPAGCTLTRPSYTCRWTDPERVALRHVFPTTVDTDRMTKGAGICVHISSLPGPYGIGDIGTTARRFVDWMVSSGLSVWQVLPLGPTGFGDSPYQLLSAFAGNPLLIDLDNLGELGLLERYELDSARAPDSRRVSYASVIAGRQRLLELAADRLEQRPHAVEAEEYAAFVRENDDSWLRDFALYSTIKRHHSQRAWTEWRTALRDRDTVAIRQWEADHDADLECVRRIQFLFFRQWHALREYSRSRGVTLFGDVPIYLAQDCADSWAGRDMLYLDANGRPIEVAGVPPDYFNDEGQRWGNPLYRWDWHDDHDFDWWIRRLKQAFAHFDMVRLDHFRGFDAYWAIPADAPACEGEWRPGPGKRLFDVLRRALGQRPMVAEDLGEITESVIDLRRQFEMPGMQVLQFLVGSDRFDPYAIAEDCVCYTGTHDNDTTLGWFKGSGRPADRDLAAWQSLVVDQLQCRRREVPSAMIELALDSDARLAIVPAQDFLELDSDARMNHPGRDSGNWLWRLSAGQLDEQLADRIRAMITASSRTTIAAKGER